MSLLIARHPRTRAPEGLCYGRWEPPPGPDEASATEALLARLKTIRSVVASPSQRCRIPAERIAAALGLPLRLDERLQELDFGSWEGRGWEEIDRRESDWWAEDPINRAPPGGESFAAMQARVGAAWADLRLEERPFVLTHAGVIRAFWILTGTHDFAKAFAKSVPFAEPIEIAP